MQAALDDLLINKLGLVKQYQRYIFGWAVGSAAVWIAKPSFAFEGNDPRPWSVLDPVGEGVRPTITPWWVPGLISGLGVSLFI